MPMNVSRRHFFAGSAAAGLGVLASFDARAEDKLPAASDRPEPADDQALVAITLDLEMSRNFPKWGDTHWDYEKGNLNAETKAYAVEAARRVKAHGLQGLRCRGRPPRQGPRRRPALLRGRPRLRAGERGLAEGPRGRGPSGRQPHLRPRQRQGHAPAGP